MKHTYYTHIIKNNYSFEYCYLFSDKKYYIIYFDNNNQLYSSFYLSDLKSIHAKNYVPSSEAIEFIIKYFELLVFL